MSQAATDGAARQPPSSGQEAIGELIAERRKALPPDCIAQDRWGLALSGGGIRSATFCFGLLKSLAQNRVLNRFDLLSTVSGGGYVGAMLGKLHHDCAQGGKSQDDVEAALATADERWFTWWLRANGRYLIPRGTKDLLFAVSTFGRNLAGIHIELAFMALAMGLLLIGFDGLVWCAFDLATADVPPGQLSDSAVAIASRWPTPWLLLPLPGWLAVGFSSAYWILPRDDKHTLGWRRWAMIVMALAVMAAIVAGWEWLRSLGMTPSSLVIALFVVSAWTLGASIAQTLATVTAFDRATARNKLTGWLAGTVTAGLVILLLGCVDFLAWHLATTAREHQDSVAFAVVAIGVALRVLLPKVAEHPRSLTPGLRRGIGALFNIAGLLTLAGLAVVWVSVVHRLVTGSMFSDIAALGELGRAGADYQTALQWFVLLFAPVLLVMLFSASNAEFLNRSSLHTFYRSRLTRGYLGAANGGRFGPGVNAMDSVPRSHRPASAPVSVGTVDPRDDVAMSSYAPHVKGGPVHLINVCVNQTRDPRGGLFNQDRKGLLLTVGPRGWCRVNNDAWTRIPEDSALSLGSWMAISGAAFSPGLGSSTRPGIAALATMAGIRLGYWWQREPPRGRDRKIGKYKQLVSELLGRFDGDAKSSWFLSDGGHFENTAAYALLRERCRLVVLADCGADPRYAFGDLENLVRKARIDLQAEITFLKPVVPLAQSWKAFGSLNDIVSSESSACLALARVKYVEQDAPAYLVVVKPSMCVGLPVDLVNFKADNPDFPQEPTTDQFFAEAQWESYFQLGSALGTTLKAELLADLPRVAERDFAVDDGVPAGDSKRAASSTETAATAAAHAAGPIRRLPARIVATGAVTASLSVGAIVSLVGTAWQAVEAEARQRRENQPGREIDKATFKELTDLYAKYLAAKSATGSDRGSVVELSTAIARVGELTCTTKAAGRPYQESQLMTDILAQVQAECRKDESRATWACRDLADDDLGSANCLRKPPRPQCAPRYWVRDYQGSDENCRTRVATEDALSAALERLGKPLPAAREAVAVTAPKPDFTVRPPPAAANGEGGRRPAAANGGGVKPAAPASAPVPAGAAARARAAKPACEGDTVYIQIHGPGLRQRARDLRAAWRELGASVPPIEDVWHSAAQAGRAKPDPVSAPTILMHEAGLQGCADALKDAGAKMLGGEWQIKRLPARLRAVSGVLEVWIPATL